MKDAKLALRYFPISFNKPIKRRNDQNLMLVLASKDADALDSNFKTDFFKIFLKYLIKVRKQFSLPQQISNS